MASLRIIKPGLLTTVQDLGRWGYQAEGVPVSGAMDACAHRLANLLVGNPEGAATLEITVIGPEILFEGACAIAVTGADLSPAADAVPVPLNTVCAVPDGTRLRFGARRGGARSYLAVAGGIETPPIFGSRATHLMSHMGGVGGRALAAGDQLAIGAAASPPPQGRTLPPVFALPDGGAVLRVLAGPQEDWFAETAFETLEAGTFVISRDSDRTGYRLDGPPLAHRTEGPMISDVTPLGTIQVPASGRPILLMADRQTCGGYPQIATVISADMPLAGQLAPGDWIRFRRCTPRDALAALIAQERVFIRG